MKVIDYSCLPVEAYEAISQEQQSYIDEFTFYEVDTNVEPEYLCQYAGDFLCVWRGGRWREP